MGSYTSVGHDKGDVTPTLYKNYEIRYKMKINRANVLLMAAPPVATDSGESLSEVTSQTEFALMVER